MPLPPYTYTGPLDHTSPINRSACANQSVIITGGANGIGEECVRQYVAAGAFVTFGDMSERGYEIEKELNAQYGKEVCVFVKVDIRDWEEQRGMFEVARRKSPGGSVDVVIANAGISRSSGDSLWTLDDPKGEPTKPDLNIVRVNIDGTLYTWKLAVHYFRMQPDVPERDRCFIITGSMVAWIDSPGNWEYTATKYALRGFMRTARRNSWEQGIRINYVAPCFIKSAIRTAEYEQWLEERGVQFGEPTDCAAAMMRISCDKTVNGHSIMICPRSLAKEGFMDVDRDDYKDIEGDAYMRATQATQLRIIEDQWKDDYKVRIFKA